MHIAAAIGMHMKDGIDDWDAAGISAIDSADSMDDRSELSPQGQPAVTPLDLTKLGGGKSTVMDSPPLRGDVAEVSLRSLESVPEDIVHADTRRRRLRGGFAATQPLPPT